MTEAALTVVEARALALRAQGFGDPELRRPIDVLDRLGVIQLDSVNVLARSHEIVPFSRIGPYSVDELYSSIYQERRGFEYWGHVASWLPMDEYALFLHRMERRREHPRGWRQLNVDRRVENSELYAAILERIRNEGALGAVAFEDTRERRGTWWDWKPAKSVLEDLFDQGLLMSAGRARGFNRLYDLPERVLPPNVTFTDPGPAAAARALMLRAIAAMGIGTGAEAADYFRLPVGDWRPALADLLSDGSVVRVQVEGWREPALVVPEALEMPRETPVHRATFLSPFDNLLWERRRVERLFDFHYRLEIYVPQGKRTHGYYVLPLLARGQLLGRADLKLDRKAKCLLVQSIRLEGAESREAASALKRLAKHLGAQSIRVEQVIPERSAAALRRLVA